MIVTNFILRTILSVIFFAILLIKVPSAEARKAPYPILFLHGLAESADRWYMIQPKLERLGLHFGGKVWIEKKGNRFSSYDYLPENDYFFVNFSDNQGSVMRQVEETRLILLKILEDSGADKVVLVGFSMGGLVGRIYLVENLLAHHVAKLVTIGSPHQGSNWSRFYSLIAPAKQSCKEKKFYQMVSNYTICPLIEKLESVGGGLRLDSRAIYDLTPPEWGFQMNDNLIHEWVVAGVPKSMIKCVIGYHGHIIINPPFFRKKIEYECNLYGNAKDILLKTLPILPLNLIAKTATLEHPGDVTYISTVGEIDSPDGVDELFKTTGDAYMAQTQDPANASVSAIKLIVFIKKAIGLVSANPKLMEGGDGAVSISSQDISRLPWFSQRILHKHELQKKPREKIKYLIKGLKNELLIEKVETVHMSQILQFDDIYKELLEL